MCAHIYQNATITFEKSEKRKELYEKIDNIQCHIFDMTTELIIVPFVLFLDGFFRVESWE